MLRWVVRLWWLAFVLYVGNAIFNLFTLVASSAPVTGEAFDKALLLDKVIHAWTQTPALVVDGAALLIILIFLEQLAGTRGRHRLCEG